MHRDKLQRGAFSLIELVIVVVIIGTIGAIAVPRMSRAATGAGEAALRGDLALLRGAIEAYRVEHDNTPPTDASTIAGQLTMYTNRAGATSATRTGEYQYGPYLREMPKAPVGLRKGDATVRDLGTPGTGTQGWFYFKDTGDITANTNAAEFDSAGKLFNTY